MWEETVGLAMFSDRVTIEENETLVDGLGWFEQESNRAESVYTPTFLSTILKEGVRLVDFATT